ncbi:hypothetical protein [Actinoplanes sp. NPDC049802]|uniref:hypothetical protein n=1 Tax=Actinoplanes sp. NPDC049802 TaxID=3154742 RepID=UPI0033E057D0
MRDVWSVVRRTLGVVGAGATGLMLAGCPLNSPDRLEYRFGVARIGDDYHLFAPLCPGEKIVGLKVDDPEAAGQDPDDDQFSDDASTWWRVQGPKAATGPGEFIVLGVDGPFTDVAVRAGSNPAYRVLPGEFRVWLAVTDLRAATNQLGSAVMTADVPVHPAGSNPATVDYRVPMEKETFGAAEIRTLSDCALGSGPVPSVSVTAVPGQQADAAMRPGAAERAGRSMLDPAAVTGMTPVPRDPPYQEDVAAHVCANGPRSGAISTAFGQERVWQAATGSEVRQFAGAYGEIPATDVVTQVEGMLGCGEYSDGGHDFREIHEVDLPALPDVDRQLMFCEESDEEPSRCTVLLAEKDILSRLIVTGSSENETTGIARSLASEAAAALS